METNGAEHVHDVAVVGGGQAGLAAGYFLRRAGLDFVVLDERTGPGGSWNGYWDSLRLFSPAGHSMLPGWWMPAEEGHEYPSARHVAWYLTEYERRYGLPVHRPVHVGRVERADGALRVIAREGTWRARYVVSATGTWRAPHVPRVPGREEFEGQQQHTVDYRGPEEFAGRRVVVVGGGNSAAQILAELSQVAETTWATLRPPRFLPDDVDGRALFDIATRSQRAAGAGRPVEGFGDLGDIVVVPGVREARERGALKAEPMFERLTRTGVAWADGTSLECDAVLWCTGFRPVLDHLAPLGLADGRGRIALEGTRAVDEPRLFLLGYGDWTGPASATLIGAGRTAKATVAEITGALAREG
ncbi:MULTISPECIES: ArsO family NAD(P)H-dependent flavin-containing monooxygenase [Nocardiopsis]|uniref:Pyridine nucleotide-disulfide oxidoreductase n=1 Tax=Nocardiopsis sinuspersici TaxID=501010 RepID=A0A1V3BYD6_9ACTN|nr:MULTISPECIES: ArsO family NAD(P)H-dependent flavin-containing monooxygenase [Nocardiopsis]OOC53567.1 pyridine nucleotide-disulfide oxidoreductase [Nocardiopsis sinuspersici]